MNVKLERRLAELVKHLHTVEGPTYNGTFGEGYEAASHGAGDDLQRVLIDENAWDDRTVMSHSPTLGEELNSLLGIWKQVAQGKIQVIMAPEEQKGFQDCAGQAAAALVDVMKRHGVLK